MNSIQALTLGIVQGLTEFLPVSSSGHLAIARQILGTSEALITFDVLVHLGTLVSVLVVYREDVLGVIKAFVAILGEILSGRPASKVFDGDEYRRLALLIIAGSLPAAFMGIFLENVVGELFASLRAVASMLIFTGILLWVAEKVPQGKRTFKDFGLTRGLLVGFGQGLAIAPGLSRSGTTISTGLVLGLSRGRAATYSFLLSIPVILGAAAFEGKDILHTSSVRGAGLPFLVGFLAAAVSGYFAINLVLQALKSRKLTAFSYYCWILGASVFIWQAFWA